jgi:hypothetical protein
LEAPRATRVDAIPGDSEVADSLSTATIDTLQNPDFWREFGAIRGLHVIGPSIHGYLDRDPGPIDGVTLLPDDDLRSLREGVDEADWTESGGTTSRRTSSASTKTGCWWQQRT